MTFPLEALKEHRLLRTGLWTYIRSTSFPVILSVPLIYACAIPFALLDLSVTIYQVVLSDLWNPEGPAEGLPDLRSEQSGQFERNREGGLHLLFL